MDILNHTTNDMDAMTDRYPGWPRSILVPVDVAECPIEPLLVLNAIAGRLDVKVTLLHVICLRIVPPENRVYDDIGSVSQRHLVRLAKEFMAGVTSPRLRVRMGRPHEEILAEAVQGSHDLILLATRRLSRWQQVFGARTVAKVIREAPCPVIVLPVRTVLNCDAWAPNEPGIIATPLGRVYWPSRTAEMTPTWGAN
jgi:nucleotide-binding universal stress UspA family protein